MTDVCRIVIDGVELDVPAGVSVAAAVMNAGLPLRRSVSGEPRAALCGMGICHECRVTINDRAHVRSCMTVVVPGMRIQRDA